MSLVSRLRRGRGLDVVWTGAPGVSLWEAVLPDEVLRLLDEMARTSSAAFSNSSSQPPQAVATVRTSAGDSEALPCAQKTGG
jgi:hypothetical protein